MQKYQRQIVSGLIIVLALYIVTLIGFDSFNQSEDSVWEALAQFPLWLIPVLCLTQVSANFFRFLEWQYYLGVIDARDKISLKDSAIIFTASFTMVVSPGKIAELLKAVLLKIRTGVPVAISAPIVIAERVVDGLAVIVMLTLALLFSSEQLALGDYRAISEGIVYTSAALLAFGLIAVQLRPLAYLCLGIIARLPLIQRLHQPLTDFYESSREIFKLKHVIPTTTLGIGVYLSSTIGFYLILWGFGLDLSWTLFLQTAFMVGVASAIGALSFIPNGAGITEVSNAAMLLIIVAPSHPEVTVGVAAAMSLLQGFFHKWFRVVVGLAVAVIYRERLFTPELESELDEMEHQAQVSPAPTPV